MASSQREVLTGLKREGCLCHSALALMGYLQDLISEPEVSSFNGVETAPEFHILRAVDMEMFG